MLVGAVKAPSNFPAEMQSEAVASHGWLPLTVSVHAPLSGGHSVSPLCHDPPHHTLNLPKASHSQGCVSCFIYVWRERVLADYGGGIAWLPKT